MNDPKNSPIKSFMGRFLIRSVVFVAVSLIKLKSFSNNLLGSAIPSYAPTHVQIMAEKYPVFKRLSSQIPGIHGSHRGGGSTFGPENTLYTYRKSVFEARTVILEVDLHLSNDGHIVLHHDTTVAVPVREGNGFIADMSLAQLRLLDMGYNFSPDGGVTYPLRGTGIGMPTLCEVLDELVREEHLVFFFDMKSPLAVGPAMQIIEERKLHDRVIVGAVSASINERVMQLKPPQVPIAADASTMLAIYKQFLWGDLQKLEIKHDVLGFIVDPIMEGMITKSLFDQIHQTGKWIALFGASLNSEACQLRMIDFGADIILCDRPDVYRKTLESFGKV